MEAYYWTIAVVFVLALMATKTNEQERLPPADGGKRPILTKVLLALIIAILIFVAGTRYFVGSDYVAYYHGISLYGGGLLDSLKTLDEPVLPLLATVLSWFTNDGAWFIFSCSLITMLCALLPVYKHTNNILFATTLFVFAGIWHGSFNGVRQFLAAAIVFAGHRLIYDRKFLKYFLVVFLAFCVHRSAIVMILPYFILNNRISVKNIFLLILGTLILSLNYDKIFEFVGFLKSEEMSIEDQGYYSNSVNVLRVLVACAPAIFALVLRPFRGQDREKDFYINALVINGVAMIATSNSAYLARLGIYTNMFTPLAFVKNTELENKEIEKIVRAGIILLFSIYWYVEVSGSSTLKQFHWIWER